eukprot:Em0005g572a
MAVSRFLKVQRDGKIKKRKPPRTVAPVKHRRIPPPSSDEDVALTTGEEKVDIPVKVPRSVEDTKGYLRDYIMSKKPPATFETPTTQPTFHEGASFGAVKVAVDPTHTTDCLLVLKLFEAGTLEQQPEGPLLSAEAQTGFEFLLNSWLATLAIVGEEGKEEGPLVSALPVRVTGLLQTVINGSRCLVVGVASSAARSHPNRDVDTAGTQALQDVLDRVTVKEALTPVLVFASNFYWHSLYTAASHQSAEAFSSQTPLETTVCVVPLSPPFLGELVLVVVQEVYRVGLDLAGVRLLYDQSAASLLEGNGTETGGDCLIVKINRILVKFHIYKILVKNDKILVKNDKILTKIPKIFSLGSLNCTRVRVSKMSLRATTNLMRVKHKYARVTHGYHS